MRTLRILFALATVGAICAALSVSAASAATATASDNPPAIAYAYSNIPFAATDAVKVQAVATGKEQVAFTMPKGLSKSLKAHATSCLVASNVTRPARGHEKCGRIKIGTYYTNSGICRSTGRFCMFGDHVKAGDTFYLNGRQWRKGKCGNKVWISVPHPRGKVLPASRVQVVQYLSYQWKVSLHVALSATGAVYAQCAQGGASAWAYAYASDFVTDTIYFYATARTRQTAMTIANARASVSESETESLKGQVQAKIAGEIHLAVGASCSGQPSAPSPTPPGVPTPPSPPTPPTPSCGFGYTNVNGVCQKDGTTGPGAGTPGSPGGTGSGGSPGTTLCRDSSGNMVPGTPDPTTGNCPGVTNGGGTTGGTSGGVNPPPPAPAQCIDPFTNQLRNEGSNEGKDQFGYCYTK
jgi:hypothetical protein